jgi:hypothetical protein
MQFKDIREALFHGRAAPISTEQAALAYNEVLRFEVAIDDLVAALESTTWSSGCWCSGKDKRGHSATCEGRRVAIRQAGAVPPGKDIDEPTTQARGRRKR